MFHEHVKEYKLAFSDNDSNYQVYQENGKDRVSFFVYSQPMFDKTNLKQGAHIHQPMAWPVPHACAQPYHPGRTALHGCHCPSDIAVRVREVLARPWVGVCVPLALSLSYL